MLAVQAYSIRRSRSSNVNNIRIAKKSIGFRHIKIDCNPNDKDSFDFERSIKKRSSRDVILRRRFIASFGRELDDRRQSGCFKWISKLS